MAGRIDYAALSDDERKELDRKLALADGIKMYKNAGGMGVGMKYKSAAVELARGGGLPEGDALNMARYRQYKNTIGNDPSFQGPINMNTGEREPLDTDEEIEARRTKFLASKGSDRSSIWADAKLKNERAQERVYDDLVAPKRESQDDVTTIKNKPSSQIESITKAKALLKRQGKSAPTASLEDDEETRRTRIFKQSLARR